MGVPAVWPWVRPVPSLGLSSPTWKSAALPESPSSPSSTLIHEPGRGAPVRAQRDVTEPCLPNARHVDWKTGSWESHGRDKRRKEEVPERQSRKKENGYS